MTIDALKSGYSHLNADFPLLSISNRGDSNDFDNFVTRHCLMSGFRKSKTKM